MKKFAQSMIAKAGITLDDFSGAGIAMPGIVDFKKKCLISINGKYNTAVDFDIQGWIEENMGLPVVIENDANAALMGEYVIGTTKGASYAALFILGTGVGTAAMLEGKLIRGAHNQAGCLGGHFIIDYKGRACNCGSIGCLEAQASTWALPEIVKNTRGFHMSTLMKEKFIQVKQVVDHAKAGDVFSNMILEDFIEKWSGDVINLIYAFDPEVIVLSGGIVKAGAIITKPLIERVKKFAWTPYGTIDIVISEAPEHSVLYGLENLMRQELKQ